MASPSLKRRDDRAFQSACSNDEVALRFWERARGVSGVVRGVCLGEQKLCKRTVGKKDQGTKPKHL